jgi:hypothetical protein
MADRNLEIGGTQSLRSLTGVGGLEQPASVLFAGQQQSQNIAQGVPEPTFTQQIINLLKQYQNLGTAPIQQAEFGARAEQFKRLGAETPQELIGASPQLQAGVRQAGVEALQPTISGLKETRQTFQEQLKSFGTGLEQARGLIGDFQKREQEEKNKQRDDARTVIKDALTLVGGGAFEGASPEEISELEKRAGYPKGYLDGVKTTLKERDLELKRQISEERAQLAKQREGELSQTREQLRLIRDLAIKEKTESSRGQLIHSATKQNVTETGPLVTQVTNLKSLQGVSAYVKEKIESGINTGAVKGWVTFKGLLVPALQETLDPETVELQADIITLFTQYVYAMTGAQVNELEFELAARKTPSIQGTTENNKKLLDSFDRGIGTKLNAILETKGWTFAGEGAETQTPTGQTQSPPTMKIGNKIFILQPNGKYIEQK